MAYEKQNFRNADRVVPFTYTVMNAIGDFLDADTNLRDLTKLICTNVDEASKPLIIYETDANGENPVQIHTVNIPGSSGKTAGVFAINLLQDSTYQLPGVRYDAFGNFFLRIAPGKKLSAQSSTDEVLYLIGETESYES